jgi:hypothetical protein
MLSSESLKEEPQVTDDYEEQKHEEIEEKKLEMTSDVSHSSKNFEDNKE